MRLVTVVLITSLLTGSAWAGPPLAPGSAAGVKQAQHVSTVWWMVIGGVIVGGAALAISGLHQSQSNSNTNTPTGTGTT